MSLPFVVLLDEAGKIEATLRFLRLHELLPHGLAAVVLRHQERDAKVDADHIFIHPSRTGMKRVSEAIPLEYLGVVLLINRGNNSAAVLWQENKRSRRRAGNDGAIDGTHLRRPTPNDVAFARIGGGN